MHALRMALQYELGIDGPTGNFGPGTVAATLTIELVNGPDKYPQGVLKVLEGAMWCHGYDPGQLFFPSAPTTFNGTLVNELSRFYMEVGINTELEASPLTPHLFKSLLSTDAFNTVWTGGNNNLVATQRRINRIVINGYKLAPDYLGGYIATGCQPGRKFSNILIYYLQALMGPSPSEAGGNLGPATQKSLPVISKIQPGKEDYNFILAATLLSNGYPHVIADGTFNASVVNGVYDFQKEMRLEADGVVGRETWLALLVSYGDQDRKPTAADTRYDITNARADYLLERGIKYVGRYLTGGDFKELREGEAQRLLAKGIKVFLIQQGTTRDDNDEIGSTEIEYYTTAQAITNVKEAVESAKRHNFPSGTIIYFAVDCDANEYQIYDVLIPYFNEVSKHLEEYKLGVYGARHVCNLLTSNTSAIGMFVSNMASGWSGNLGFPMPKGWTFNQYYENKKISAQMVSGI